MSQKEILDNEVVMMNKSLHPIAMYGETLPYIRDYYDYNIVKRGDVVVLDIDGQWFIRIVRAVASEELWVEKRPNYNYYLMYLNGRKEWLNGGRYITDSYAKPFRFSDKNLLQLGFSKNNHALVIGENMHLMMTNNYKAYEEKEIFGLFSESYIVGKIDIPFLYTDDHKTRAPWPALDYFPVGE